MESPSTTPKPDPLVRHLLLAPKLHDGSYRAVAVCCKCREEFTSPAAQTKQMLKLGRMKLALHLPCPQPGLCDCWAQLQKLAEASASGGAHSA